MNQTRMQPSIFAEAVSGDLQFLSSTPLLSSRMHHLPKTGFYICFFSSVPVVSSKTGMGIRIIWRRTTASPGRLSSHGTPIGQIPSRKYAVIRTQRAFYVCLTWFLMGHAWKIFHSKWKSRREGRGQSLFAVWGVWSILDVWIARNRLTGSYIGETTSPSFVFCREMPLEYYGVWIYEFFTFIGHCLLDYSFGLSFDWLIYLFHPFEHIYFDWSTDWLIGMEVCKIFGAPANFFWIFQEWIWIRSSMLWTIQIPW